MLVFVLVFLQMFRPQRFVNLVGESSSEEVPTVFDILSQIIKYHRRSVSLFRIGVGELLLHSLVASHACKMPATIGNHFIITRNTPDMIQALMLDDTIFCEERPIESLR